MTAATKRKHENPEADEPPAPRAKPKGFPVRLYLEDEAPTIGCGYRKVIWQFRGKKVVLHHGDYTQAIKRATFKELIASNKRYRSRNRRPALKLVVNNPKPPQSFVEAA
jgi:hypothetical protein